nr:hypothetical protein [Comamonas jiangduensis]
MSGYPTQDTALNVETASSNEIADALSQLSRIAVLGDDWEFLTPRPMHRPCHRQKRRAKHCVAADRC